MKRFAIYTRSWDTDRWLDHIDMDNPFVHAHVIVLCSRMTMKMSNQKFILFPLLTFWLRSWSVVTRPMSNVHFVEENRTFWIRLDNQKATNRNSNRRKRECIPPGQLLNCYRYLWWTVMQMCAAETVTFGQNEEYTISLIDIRAHRKHTPEHGIRKSSRQNPSNSTFTKAWQRDRHAKCILFSFPRQLYLASHMQHTAHLVESMKMLKFESFLIAHLPLPL